MVATDAFSSFAKSPTRPARNMAVVTPDDDADLGYVAKLYIGTGGDVEVNGAESGTAIVFKNVPSGTLLPIEVSRVLDGNTTALDIVALW